VIKNESSLNRAYHHIYDGICGKHPDLRPWHFQWLATYYLYRRFRQLLPGYGGRVLDVGCGGKPYRSWFGAVTEYVGLDVVPGSSVDVVVSSNDRWPLLDEHFDVLFSSQVLEHVENLEFTLLEMKRVLKKGGGAVLAFPFLYNEHGTPWDYRRFTVHGAERLFLDFEIVQLDRLGGIGSTLALLLLNWLSNSRFLKALMPIWIPFSLVVNSLGLLMDKMDRTGAFYNNVLLVVKKKSEV
jgi:SAM-dependent methyltransferase